MQNEVHLTGFLGKDPEVRSLNSGGKVVSFSLATSESWKDKQSGERKEKTEWHNIVIWNEQIAGIAEKYIKKGSLVQIRGQLETRKWQDQSGNDRYSTEVVLRFDGKLRMLPNGKSEGSDNRGGGGGGRQENRQSDSGNNGGGRTGTGGGSFTQDMDDDIPFAPEWR